MPGKRSGTGRRGPACGCCACTRSGWPCGTIQRVFGDLGLPYLRRTRKRAPRQLKLFEKAEPGESVQVDVKFVKIAGQWAFQYTALDDCTRFRVLRLYRRLYHGSSLAFLAELRRAFPFPIRRLQCDNGREFPLEFALAVEAAGIRHRYIRPRRPQQNGKVERSHRIDHEEFWSRQTVRRLRGRHRGASPAGRRTYNYERLSLALKGRTPAEKLAAALPPRRPPDAPVIERRLPTSRPGSILTRPNTSFEPSLTLRALRSRVKHLADPRVATPLLICGGGQPQCHD